MIRILYIPTDGPAVTRQVDPSLETMQGLVGGWIESIGGPDWGAYLNEEGKLLGLLGNARATLLATRLGWTYLPGDFLVGAVVFFGPLDDDGENTTLTEQTLQHAVEVCGVID